MVVPRPILVDSDGGVDDAVALWYACTSSELELLAVTAVAGNVTAEQAAANAATVLAAAGREDVPVALGAADPLGPVPPVTRPAATHGADGLGDTRIERAVFTPSPLPADELLVRLVGERPDEVTVVNTGPMTNLARALRLDPSFAERVHWLVAMGGFCTGRRQRHARRGSKRGARSDCRCGGGRRRVAPPTLARRS